MKGDRIELIERDDDFGDGWFLGRHIEHGTTGLFPEGMPQLQLLDRLSSHVQCTQLLLRSRLLQLFPAKGRVHSDCQPHPYHPRSALQAPRHSLPPHSESKQVPPHLRPPYLRWRHPPLMFNRLSIYRLHNSLHRSLKLPTKLLSALGPVLEHHLRAQSWMRL